MSELSRRNFLYAGGIAAGAAAVTATALASPAGHVMGSASPSGPAAPVEVWEPEGDDQMVLYVSNTGSGEVTVLTDGHEVVFTDSQLVARVQQAAKKASV